MIEGSRRFKRSRPSRVAALLARFRAWVNIPTGPRPDARTEVLLRYSRTGYANLKRPGRPQARPVQL